MIEEVVVVLFLLGLASSSFCCAYNNNCYYHQPAPPYAGSVGERPCSRASFFLRAAAGSSLAIASALRPPEVALARNLPEGTGAKGGENGSLAALEKVVALQKEIVGARNAAQSGDFNLCNNMIARLPADERSFKRVFDEYSDPPSLKTKWKDANAMVVYYAQGFDGPDRAKMGTREEEEEDPLLNKQTAQYGFRNDAWRWVDESRGILSVVGGSLDENDMDDLKLALDAACAAVSGYLSLAPAADVVTAAK